MKTTITAIGMAVTPGITKRIDRKTATMSRYLRQDTEVYVEETLSLDEVEKDMIKRALAKHGGKRRGAAADLNISERTLYRKIKEYNLE